ncbi:MAG TPA: DUF433 domain-containing protein [Pirellulales bacterium]|jgi:uncharacterized protein (DUF433 family)
MASDISQPETTPPETTVLMPHIVSTPGYCGGKPRIADSRIRVQDIVLLHDRVGLSADEIVDRYPHITLAGVYAALSYYFDHRGEIDGQIEEARKFVEEMKLRYPSKLPRRLPPDET